VDVAEKILTFLLKNVKLNLCHESSRMVSMSSID